jgi:hypothetical protein
MIQTAQLQLLVREKAGGEVLAGIVVVVHGQADLLEVVLTLQTAGGLAHLLHGGQEQAQQDGDDGNDDEQLDEREGLADSHGDPLGGTTREGHKDYDFVIDRNRAAECRQRGRCRKSAGGRGRLGVAVEDLEKG